MSAWQTVIDRPTSLAARRALRDEWLRVGDPRGECLKRALALKFGYPSYMEWTRAAEEFDALLEKHRREWAGPLAERTDDFEFELGMPARVGVTANELFLHGQELVRLAPIVHVGVRGPGDIAAAVHSPALANVRTLGVGWGAVPDDAIVMAIATSPYVTNVRGLYLRDGTITTRGFRALLNSPYLRRLVYADLTGNPCETETTQFGSDYYYLGPDSGPFMDEAMQKQAMSYGSGLEWPPLDDALTWTD